MKFNAIAVVTTAIIEQEGGSWCDQQGLSIFWVMPFNGCQDDSPGWEIGSSGVVAELQLHAVIIGVVNE